MVHQSPAIAAVESDYMLSVKNILLPLSSQLPIGIPLHLRRRIPYTQG